MSRVLNLQNKPKPQKQKKTIFKNRNPRKKKEKPEQNPDEVLKSEAVAVAVADNEEMSEAKTTGKKQVNIVNNTQNFDPTEFFLKMNPALMLSLDKRKVFPDKPVIEKNVDANSKQPEAVAKADAVEKEPERKINRTKPAKTPRNKTLKITSSRPATNLNMDDFTIEYVKEFIINTRKIKDRLPKKLKNIL